MLLAVDIDPRILVSVPLPVGGCSDRIHHPFFQDFRKRPLPDPEQGEGQPVYADVVILPEGARGLHVAGLALKGAFSRLGVEIAVMVDPVGLAPQGALPFAGLLQQLRPCDGLVLRILEAAIVDQLGDRTVEGGDETVVQRQSPRRSRDSSSRC